jgi:hypothetical protein
MANLTHSGIAATTCSPHEHADLKLPSGSTVGFTSTEDLRRQLCRLGIADSQPAPRLQIINAYAATLKRIHDDAGSAAVDAFLANHKGD